MGDEQTNPKELTAADAARYLGVSRTRISELSQAGRFGRKIAGRYWIYTKDELDAYNEARQHNKGGRPKSDDLIPMPVIRAAV
jgi:hypothetical protein